MKWQVIWSDFVDLLFPRCCEACDTDLVGNEQLLCTSCRVSLPRVGPDSLYADQAANRFVHLPAVGSVQAFLLFAKRGKVQRLLHALKYRGARDLGLEVGRWFGHEMSAQENFPSVQLIVSVPLHDRKRRRRGYNQSDLLAEGISLATGIPWSGGLLKRTKYTETQTGKDKWARRENVRGVFEVAKRLDFEELMLVDDVLTTGATLEACVEVLVSAGAKVIHIRTLALAQH
ncbi:ComF family protein [Dyadobacter jejuensis]|uniref:ComF family protein n=1 Tax=Dyadobacter jejuensis TaxID=1082580 RepID=A0A316AFW1_9BACT|nr:ComF family protein [Dyadobacter jejuensis]PWJ56593.1 ComF family protein [Dyadobacter jejuensis]